MSHGTPLTLCILETDILAPELRDQHQGYGVMFKTLFGQVTPPVECRIFNVVEGQYPAADEQFDAWLVTGSKADAFGQDPWILTLKDYLLGLYQRGEKLLGICFGHQLLALLLGGKAERAPGGWGLGVQHYQITQPAPWMQPELPELALIATHQDQVSRLPDGATVIAASDYCPVAAFTIGEQVLCFQGHPEFVEDYARELYALRQKVFTPELYQRAVESLELAHHGEVAAQWMARFVAAGRSNDARLG